MKAILETLQEEFRVAFLSSPHQRSYNVPESNFIKLFQGMRRIGKTHFLYQLAREVLARGVPVERLLYINFEDVRLLPFVHSMRQLIDEWFALYPENESERCYLFLDGVEKVDVWPLVLKKIHDTRNVEIFITGTSSNLIQSEIAASLQDRTLPIEILPYSYKEYLAAHQLKPRGKKAVETMITFLKEGGIPEIQTLPSFQRTEALQRVIDRVIFRDMVERHQISNVPLLRYFIHFLLKSVSYPFSVNKFYCDIKAQGFKVGKDTLHAYLKYLEEAFLLFAVPIFTDSSHKRETTPKKIYAGDTGLIAANSFHESHHILKLFENLIYLDLRRQGKTICYYQTKKREEVSFVTQDIDGEYELIQVVWDGSDPLLYERKSRALERAKQELGFTGRIITLADLAYPETS